MFQGLPSQSSYSYAVSLASVFLIAIAVEWLSHARLIKIGTNNVLAGLQQTAIYAIRVTLAFLVMLAVMSFDTGVLLAAVAGYSIGFLIFGSQVFRKPNIEPYQDSIDLPPLNC
ncbi:copper transporter 2 [Ricinus communis]|uniref:Copper transport protein n=1 Tax=Ricinus communis TaxID=3988 RepID=B9S399_RICCO|nr:copper transporter 2 [Ricinus communis]EEF41881.1 copper transporter, putative [Ricinus communis]|eukprot:XP_002520468.1 copper transporter 2 [Ricinus communis]